VARTQIEGEAAERFLAVGDDGACIVRTVVVYGENNQFLGNVTWTRKDTGTTRDLNAVSLAPGTKIGWAVGDEGTILRTTNAGSSWGKQNSNTTRHLRAVVALDKDRAWVAGDEGELHRTDDAGATWHRQEISGLSKHLRGFAGRGDGRVAVGDDGAFVVRSGGNWFWNSITSKHLRGVAIAPDGTILVVGDDGRIGTRKPAPFTGVETGRWTWRSDVTSKHLRGVVARSNKSWLVVSDGLFLTTSDAGASWGTRAGSAMRALC
jgi:photosystem II stability/assembly factor-like uncharacterized protein